MDILIRKATSDDCVFLHELANDSQVRNMSFSSDPIALQDHALWFEEKLNNINTEIYIGVDEKERPLGQIRFDIISDWAEVDVSISPKFRGKGLGSEIIRLGTDNFFHDTNIQTVYAIVKSENIKSIRSFERAGFILDSQKIIKGADCIKLCKKRANNGTEKD